MANQQYTFVKSSDIDRGGNFVDIKSRGAATLITLNMKHAFFEKLYKVLDNLDSGNSVSKNEGEQIKQSIETIFQILIGSYAVAQKELAQDKMQTSYEFSKKIMNNWTFNLDGNIESMVESEA